MPLYATFQKPFPAQRSTRLALVSAFGFGAFVACFLFIFQPFGLHGVPEGLARVCLGYGAITTGVMLLMQLLLPRFFPHFYAEEDWTVGREIAHTMGNILLIAGGNLGYSVYMEFVDLSFGAFLIFLGFTLVVGSFPAVVGVLLRQNAYQRKYLAQSQVYNAQLDRQHSMAHEGRVVVEVVPASAKTAVPEVRITLQEDSGGKAFTCFISNLLAIEAADNYVKLHLDPEANDQAGLPFRKTELLRLTMATAEEALSKHPGFFRSHRSWMVNLDRLEKVEGNARGYRLHMAGMKEPIPVSRSRIEAFQGVMEVAGGNFAKPENLY